MAISRPKRSTTGARQRGGRAPAAPRTAARPKKPTAAAAGDCVVRLADGGRVATRRIYAPAVADEGTRVLVMRYWPRGIRRERVDVWLRDLAPPIPLLRAYLDGKITWAQYVPRYQAGLQGPPARAAVAEVRRLARQGGVTLLCGCPDPRQCHRTLLQRHLLDSGGEASS
jgi:uncharacterized protein YeaO (DUF488 family)